MGSRGRAGSKRARSPPQRSRPEIRGCAKKSPGRESAAPKKAADPAPFLRAGDQIRATLTFKNLEPLF